MCVRSVMVMQPMGMNRYEVSTNYILLCCTFSASEVKYARSLPNTLLNIGKEGKKEERKRFNRNIRDTCKSVSVLESKYSLLAVVLTQD